MELIEEQIAYYRARADEYDQWWLRLGRYDRCSTPTYFVYGSARR
jgi:hypothetical protein